MEDIIGSIISPAQNVRYQIQTKRYCLNQPASQKDGGWWWLQLGLGTLLVKGYKTSFRNLGWNLVTIVNNVLCA